MATQRLDVRLDPEHHRKLRELAQRRERTISEVVREWIDAAYDQEILRERRRQALEAIANANLPVPQDPDELKRDILTLHDIPDLY